jgi:hypothetical protein
LGEDFGKPHHPAQILLAKAGAELLNQLSPQRYENLLAIRCPLFAKNFVGDPFANAPLNILPSVTKGRGFLSSRLSRDGGWFLLLTS